MKRKCKVVILPTEDTTTLVLWGHRELKKPTYIIKDEYEIVQAMAAKYQHLYILSNDIIDEGDWYKTINGETFKPMITKCNKDSLYFANNTVNNGEKVYNKIIATTDKSLGLPEIPQRFIEKFRKQYNIGKDINEVNVEFEKKWETFIDFDIADSTFTYQPKVNEKNQVTINKIKTI